jgi:hypothetical protein
MGRQGISSVQGKVTKRDYQRNLQRRNFEKTLQNTRGVKVK